LQRYPSNINVEGTGYQCKVGFFFLGGLESALTSCQSNVRGGWRFKDGVLVENELQTLDLEKIRAVCHQQSRTRWTSITSRDRLYQFIAMSDEETQLEMRQKLVTTDSIEDFGSTSSACNSSGVFGAVINSPRPHGTKRLHMLHVKEAVNKAHLFSFFSIQKADDGRCTEFQIFRQPNFP
jgi:hypothetical protein